MDNMVDSFRKLLSTAGRSSEWRAIPEAIEEIRILGVTTTGMAFWREVATLTSRPELSVRQMCRAYEVVRRFSDRLGTDRTELALSRPYTWLEVVARIADIDPEWAVRLLEDPWKAAGVREVRQELEQVRHESVSPQDGLTRGQQRRRDAVAFVAQRLERVLARKDIALVRYGANTPAVSPSLVAIPKSGSKALAAALVVAKSDRSTVFGALRQAGWEATFFSSYWLAVPLDSDPELETVLAAFAISNLGLARFDANRSKFDVTVKPTTMVPDPDRRSLIAIPDRHQR